MTVKEIQELIKFTGEKTANVSSAASDTSEYDICRRFCDTVRDANAAGIDLTEALVEWLANKNNQRECF